MSTQQLEHQEIHNEERQFPISVICDNITSAENVGMVFRISEAMGVAHIYLCGDTLGPDHKKVLKTSRSTEKHVSYSSSPSTLDSILELKKQGFTIVALEVTNDSLYLNEADLSQYAKIALIIGNEQHGVDAEVLKAVDLSLAIKMFGKNTSINVVNSLAIALYEITRQLT
ncbi:MAG: hypothetical protein PF444_06710 [Bacteroidales bacterium]|jgi:tRNA G18 (ribose-2'-O)-methylase SpoU|nr:hypothetical protein [Bacteroidales bacterium]